MDERIRFGFVQNSIHRANTLYFDEKAGVCYSIFRMGGEDVIRGTSAEIDPLMVVRTETASTANAALAAALDGIKSGATSDLQTLSENFDSFQDLADDDALVVEARTAVEKWRQSILAAAPFGYTISFPLRSSAAQGEVATAEFPDYYETLGVPKDADSRQIKAAYSKVRAG